MQLDTQIPSLQNAGWLPAQGMVTLLAALCQASAQPESLNPTAGCEQKSENSAILQSAAVEVRFPVAD